MMTHLNDGDDRDKEHCKALNMFPFPKACIHSHNNHVYNFAYGSNLLPRKMTQRGVTWMSTTRGRLKNFRLSFNQLGFPPVEPSFANLEAECGADVHGVIYELDCENFAKIWETEGGGNWYDTVMVEVEIYDADQPQHDGKQRIKCVMFKCLPRRLTAGGIDVAPSRRYMNFLLEGSKFMDLDSSYVSYLEKLPVHDGLLLDKFVFGVWFAFYAALSGLIQSCPKESARHYAFSWIKETYVDTMQLVAREVANCHPIIARCFIFACLLPGFCLGLLFGPAMFLNRTLTSK